MPMAEVVVAPPPFGRTARSRAAPRELWLDRLARFPSSGLTVAQFCALEAVSVPSFYLWKRRLAAPPLNPTAAHDQASAPGARLLPGRLPVAAAAVELVLTSGAVLRLSPGCDLAWVRSLVTALGEPAC
jgi:hypothetical protein